MRDIMTRRILAFAFVLLTLVFSGSTPAKPEASACIELGALAYDDWTTFDAGGSGMPAGETKVDYLRCKSCHGWDRLGMDGGYVRRTRTAHRPNAGLGDSDTTSRRIAPGLGNYYHIKAEEVLHEGTGRSYQDGSGSWVELGPDPSPEDKALNAAGFTLGNQHPDFSATGANAGDIVLTEDQVDCLVDFVNNADSDPKFYFANIEEDYNPVRYTISSGASSVAGRTFYEENCLACHGEPDTDHDGLNDGKPAGGIAAYLAGDGKYSEFVHKARWGIPDTTMTRAAIGTPDAQDMIDVMLYLQGMEVPAFNVTDGISGTWYLAARDGEGFVIDVFQRDDGSWELLATYYTYDGSGNQVWLIGTGIVEGNSATAAMQITDGGTFGVMYMPGSVQRTDWGTLEFTFAHCTSGTVHVRPNQAMLDAGMGFEEFEFDITRLTPPSNCP